MKLQVKQLRSIIREELLKEGFMNKLKGLIPLVSFVFTPACDFDDPPLNTNQFAISGATDEEIAVIKAAAEEWCEATEKLDCITFGDEGDSKINVVAQMTSCTDEGPDIAGCARTVNHGDKPTFIEINSAYRTDPDWLGTLYNIARHEIGHRFQTLSGNGAQDLAPNTAMSEFVGEASPNITDADLDSVGRSRKK